MKKDIKTIAIIGNGPAGSTLATLLHRKGFKVGMFANKEPQELYVGESMIPALIPILRELGVEEEVKSFSVYKPGATVWVKNGLHAEAPFNAGLGQLPGYAYNTIRKDFDSLLFEKAKSEGVTVFPFTAGITTEGNDVFLDAETLEKSTEFFGGQPDFLIDASGRKRLFANALKLPATKGGRMDTALFAHVEGHEFPNNYGDIHMNLATKGWVWRIPVPGKTSIGIVVNREHLLQYGETPEEQYDNYLKNDPKLKDVFAGVKRVTSIQKYSNYQLQSNQVYGDNWACVGDSAGFLDPVFSSGLYFSLHFASEMVKALDPADPMTFEQYQKNWKKELGAWKKMISIFYNGRLFTNFLYGNDRLDSRFGRWVGKHAVKHYTSIFTGEAINNKKSMLLLKFMTGPLLDFMYFTRMHRYNYKDLEL